MQHLLLLIIRIYWHLPTKYHDKCIFRESCSHYVYRITKDKGFVAGIKALLKRNNMCRPGYVIFKFEERFYLKTANGILVNEDDIALSQLPPKNMQYVDFDGMDTTRIRLNSTAQEGGIRKAITE